MSTIEGQTRGVYAETTVPPPLILAATYFQRLRRRLVSALVTTVSAVELEDNREWEALSDNTVAAALTWQDKKALCK